MKKHIWFVCLALLLIASLVLSACKPATAPTATPTKAPTKTTAKRKIATFIYTQEFGPLSPLYANNRFAWITIQLWNCWAWDFDENTNPHPVLVTEIPSLKNGGISGDGTVITMTLRKDRKSVV